LFACRRPPINVAAIPLERRRIRSGFSPQLPGTVINVKRDLRQVLWVMAVLMPAAIVLTLLTSTDLQRSTTPQPVTRLATRALHAQRTEASLDRRIHQTRESRRAEVHEVGVT
jgi:hypothetical protein